MPWFISQFPELEHLEPSQRAQLLRELPWWTYPQLIARASLGALVIAALLGGAFWSSVDPRSALILCAGVALLVGAWFYHQQLSVLRSFMRLEIAKAFVGERPPFCLGCGYDLRGSNQAACPECGKALESGPPPSPTADNNEAIPPP